MLKKKTLGQVQLWLLEDLAGKKISKEKGNEFDHFHSMYDDFDSYSDEDLYSSGSDDEDKLPAQY